MAQVRERERRESESQVEQLAHRLQAVASSTEEAISGFRDALENNITKIQSIGLKWEHEEVAVRKLACAVATQEQALRQVEAAAAELQCDVARTRGETGALISVQVESLERRMEFLEQGGSELALKADRAELLRFDAALRELMEPLRRISQRSASEEARSAALERRVEQLQRQANSSSMLSNMGSQAGDTRIDAALREIASLAARVLDMEGLVEGRRCSLDGGWSFSKE